MESFALGFEAKMILMLWLGVFCNGLSEIATIEGHNTGQPRNSSIWRDQMQQYFGMVYV